MKKQEIIDYVDEVLQRYTDDEVGENEKDLYLSMSDKQKYNLYINTIDIFKMKNDIKNLTDESYDILNTNLVICFDYGCY